MSIVNIIALNSRGSSNVNYFPTAPTSSVSSSVAYGTIYSSSSWSDTSDFTLRGATLSASASRLIIGGGANTYTATAEYNNPSGIEKFKIISRFKIIETPSTSSYGIGFGIRSINTFGANGLVGKIDLRSTGGGNITINPCSNGTYSTVSTSATAMAFSQNDIIELTVDFNTNNVTVSSQNITTSGSIVSSTYTYGVSTPYVPNCGRFAIHSFGGNYEIQSLNITSTELKYASIMCIGDSKTQLYNATTWSNRYPTKLNTLHSNTIVNAGGFDRTTEVLAKINQIIAFAPQKVVLNIGSNDKRTGVSLGTWETNYSNIVTQLTNAGIDVYHLLQFNETSFDFSDYNSYITSSYSSSKIINAGTITLSGDGVHPDDAGMTQIANAVYAKIG